MSVLQKKLVPVDYDGNGTTDLGFLLPINFPTTPSVTSEGQLGAWLFDPANGLPTVQNAVGSQFIYANGNFDTLGDGFIPGFGGPVNNLFNGPAPFFPDFNGDGKTDQLFGSLRFTNPLDPTSLFEGYELATWLMNGVELLQQRIIVDGLGQDVIVFPDWANPFLYGIGGRGPLGDFDGNGTSDILLLRNGSNALAPFDPSQATQVAVWLIQDNVAFNQQIVGTANPGWKLINVNDFDGNGTDDLLFSQDIGGGNSRLAIWTLDGFTPTSQVDLGEVGVGWSVVDTNDFNGNGKADILFTQDAGGGVTNFGIWTLDGTTIVSQNFISDTSDGWGLVDHNDFNGDGKADLLFSRVVGSGTEYAFWLLDGTNAPIAQELLGVATDGFEFIQSGDVNGNGIADLTFYNDTTKEIAVWYLGSNGFATSQLVVDTYDNPANPAGWQPPFQQPLFATPPFPVVPA
jgi:hypothetical protein